MEVMVLSPCAWDSTSWYRGVHPLSKVGKVTVYEGELEWCHLDPYGVVFLQRPFSVEHLEICRMAKRLGKKVWVDHDDLATEVPKTNPHSGAFDPRVVMEIVGLADVVTVSTPELQKEFGGTVVKNAWDYGVWPKRGPKNPEDVWLWRGSDMHWDDLASSWHMFSDKTEKKWVFMGCRPMFQDRLKNYEFVPFMPIMQYFDKIREVNPSHMVIPLKDSRFNKCKSNVAWMEGYMAGCDDFYAPDWYEIPEKPPDLAAENMKRKSILDSL